MSGHPPLAARQIVTPAGPIVGRARGRVASFLGIPFALAPVGGRRFRAPARRPPWTEPFRADRFGPSPAQPASPYTVGLTFSEDCLTLNLWVPEGAAGAAVLFWVYGGGFAGGSSALPAFDGARLAAESGMVVASANHRTGALGFATLAHRGLPEASNLGVRDVILALQWLHENVSAFGGDPAHVTVMGQSSGAFVSAALLAAPTAAGLFDKLILVSGGASRLVPRWKAEDLGDALLNAAGAPDGAALRALPLDEIVDAQRRVGSQEIGARNAPVPDSFGVVLDVGASNAVLDAHPMDVIRDGSRTDIPLLFVVAGAEVAALRGPDAEFVPADRSRIVEEIASWGAPDAAAIARAYDDGDLGAMRERVLTDYIYRLPAARAALAHSMSGGSAWIVQTDHADGALADHSLPALLAFGNLPPEHPDLIVSGRLRTAIAEFVRYGELPWRRIDGQCGELMHLTGEPVAEPGELESLLRRWDGVPRP